MAIFAYRRRTPATPSNVWDFNGPTSVRGSAVSLRRVKRESWRYIKSQEWQDDAWDYYSQVGELRYVANAIAQRLSTADLFVARDGERVEGDDPLLAELASRQNLLRFGVNLFVAGSAFLVGLPDEEDGVVWGVYSTREVKITPDQVEINGQKYAIGDVYFDRVWDPHAAEFLQADSPTRSALPILRELVGLSQHISAQIDSRLAGSGVYWIPASILQGGQAPTSDAEASFSDNAVLNAILQGMLTPLENRELPSAVVPVLLGAPDDAISKIRYDTFSTPFDENTKALREEAIRRLALALDSPPELLLGMSSGNHWASWLVRDEVVQVHVLPRLQLICDGLSHVYRELKRQEGDPRADDYSIDVDVSQLVLRPNRLSDASSLHTAGVLSDEALRAAGGFDDTDAPTTEERAIKLALQVATGNAQLIDNLADLYKNFQALLDGTPETGPPLPPTPPGRPGAVPGAVPRARPQTPLPETDALPAGGPPV